MKILSRLSIGLKLWAGFLALMVLIVVVIVVSYWASNEANHTIVRTGDSRVPLLKTTARAQADLLLLSGEVRQSLTEEPDQMVSNYDQYLQDFQQNLDWLDLHSDEMGLENQARLAEIRQMFRTWKVKQSELQELHTDRMQREPAFAWLNDTGIVLMNNILDNFKELSSYESNRPASEHNTELVNDLARFQQSFGSMVRSLRSYIQTGDANLRYYEYHNSKTMNDDAWNDILLRRDRFPEPQQQIIDAIKRDRRALLDQIDNTVFDIMDSEEWRKDYNMFYREVLPLTNDMLLLLEEMSRDLEDNLTDDLTKGSTSLKNARQKTVAWGFGALAFGMGMIFLLQRHIAGRVGRLTQVAHDIQQGNFAAKAPVEVDDELGTFARTFNAMTEQLCLTITQREKAEAKLRESEELFRHMVEHIVDVFWVAEPENLTTSYLSPSYEQLWGRSMRELEYEPHSWRDAIHPDDRERVSGITETLKDGKQASVDYRIIHPDGSIRWIWDRGFPVYRENTLYRVVGVARDMTEQHNAEEEIRRINAELEQRVVERTARLDDAVVQLQQQNEMLQYQAHLIASVSEAIISTDTNFVIQSWNNAAEAIYGWTAAEAIGKKEFELLHTEPPTDDKEAMTSLFFAYEGTREGEVTHRHKDGHTVAIFSSSSVLRDEQGYPIGAVSVNRDITRRKAAEKALRESEDRYRTLVELSPDAIGMHDLDLRITFCNAQTPGMFGYDSVDELTRLTMLDLVSDETRPRMEAEAARFLATGSVRVIYMMKRKDGTLFPAEVHGRILNDDEGNPQAGLGIIRDITELKRTEADLQAANTELERKNQILSTLIDGLNDGLVLLDEHGAVLAINQTVASLLDKPADVLVQQGWSDLCEQAGPAFSDSDKEVLRALREQKEQSGQLVYTDQHDKEHIFDLKIIPLLEPAPREGLEGMLDVTPFSVIVHMVDMTEQFLMQVRMVENERFAASGRIAATVAHEVNTPLQAMEGLFYLIQTARRKAERDEYLIKASEEVERIGHILHELLEFSRPRNTSNVLVDVTMLLERVLLLSSGTMARQRITVTRHMAPEIPLVPGLPGELTQILLNIVLNAVDAMPDGGKLFVTTRVDAPEDEDVPDVPDVPADQHPTPPIVVEIADTGVGIPPELVAKIFEPFFTTKSSGTGLGLAVSQKLIQRYHGHITVTSAPGKGTTFTIVLPTVGRDCDEGGTAALVL